MRSRGFSADKTHLWRAAEKLRTFVPAVRPHTIPFQGLWIDVAEQQVTLSITNGDLTVASELLATTWKRGASAADEAGPVAVPAHVTTPLLRRLPAGMIHVEVDDRRLRLHAGTFVGDIELITSEVAKPERPLIPHVSAQMPASVLTSGFRHLALSLEHGDGWNPALQGLELRPSPGELRFTATDKRTLAQADLVCHGATVPPTMQDEPLLLPRTALHPLAQLLGEEGEVRVGVRDGRAEFTHGGTRIQVPLGVESFVDYAPVVREAPASVFRVQRATLLGVLERADLMPPASGAAVELVAGDGSVVCRTDGGEVGDTVESVDAEMEGPDFTLTLPLGPLIAMLRLLPGEHVEVGSHATTKPISIIDPASPALRYYMMPITTPLRPRRRRWRRR